MAKRIAWGVESLNMKPESVATLIAIVEGRNHDDVVNE